MENLITFKYDILEELIVMVIMVVNLSLNWCLCNHEQLKAAVMTS